MRQSRMLLVCCTYAQFDPFDKLEKCVTQVIETNPIMNETNQEMTVFLDVTFGAHGHDLCTLFKC